jgi:hypothetical protein
VVDQGDSPEKRKIGSDQIADALNEIIDTKAGVIFLTWLKERCYFDRSTIVGNPETYEVNTIGSISQEFLRRLYLDIRRKIKPELRKRIEQ